MHPQRNVVMTVQQIMNAGVLQHLLPTSIGCQHTTVSTCTFAELQLALAASIPCQPAGKLWSMSMHSCMADSVHHPYGMAKLLCRNPIAVNPAGVPVLHLHQLHQCRLEPAQSRDCA